jgi:hypothetical protein
VDESLQTWKFYFPFERGIVKSDKLKKFPPSQLVVVRIGIYLSGLLAWRLLRVRQMYLKFFSQHQHSNFSEYFNVN